MTRRAASCVLAGLLLLTACGTTPKELSAISSGVSKSDIVDVTNTADDANSANSELPEALAMADDKAQQPFSYTLCFAGDINFDDTWSNMVYYHNHGDNIYNCIDEDFIN